MKIQLNLNIFCSNSGSGIYQYKKVADLTLKMPDELHTVVGHRILRTRCAVLQSCRYKIKALTRKVTEVFLSLFYHKGSFFYIFFARRQLIPNKDAKIEKILTLGLLAGTSIRPEIAVSQVPDSVVNRSLL